MEGRIKLIAIRCADLQQSRSFYESLSLKLQPEQHDKGPPHYSVAVNGTLFELYPKSAERQIDNQTRLGFSVPNLDGVISALRANGVEIITEPRETPWGKRAVVRDPDGRAVELYE